MLTTLEHFQQPDVAKRKVKGHGVSPEPIRTLVALLAPLGAEEATAEPSGLSQDNAAKTYPPPLLPREMCVLDHVPAKLFHH